ncbi:ATP-binding cassette domain-containing protein, partial [Candidatus Woesearchaeota archaeon]|nr:ATP-binding cassette domain-containing protein [Candidatus Woesearchaeota archaeon]
ESTSVVVIEHDLIVIDYLADQLNIMYGKEKVYGIVAQPKPAKAGINAYLEGFIREDNVRFRGHKIKFEVRAHEKRSSKSIIAQWPAMEKKLGKFHLSVSGGSIHRQEIIGIIGPNGIGKTTFVRLLAGVEKPDTGSPETKVTVSYKPQTLDSSSEKTVLEVLQEAIQKHMSDVITPLNIQDLFAKPLNTLSGGELQRVAIAQALSRKADLILLDEPSAYLDVEQRLIVSKVIKSIAETRGCAILVVDHDLLFIDYLSDRLIVFEGTPARDGIESGPYAMEEGMNKLLQEVSITLRREEHSGRPRINKPGSVLDREQQAQGKLYYA